MIQMSLAGMQVALQKIVWQNDLNRGKENKAMNNDSEKKSCRVSNNTCRQGKLVWSLLTVSALGLLLSANSKVFAQEPSTSHAAQNVSQLHLDNANVVTDEAARPRTLSLLLEGNDASSRSATPAAYYSFCSTLYGRCVVACDFPGETCYCFVPGATIAGRCF
jgi:hypothetical protein